MIVKYKVTDFAKDTGLPVRKILDTLTAIGVKDKKNSSVLEEKELNALLDRLSRDNSEADLSAFLNSAKPEPKAAPAKDAAPKGAKNGGKNAQNGQPKAGKGGNNNNGGNNNGGAKQPQNQGQNQGKNSQNAQGGQNARKNQPQQPHKKRDEKTVSFSELARETGAGGLVHLIWSDPARPAPPAGSGEAARGEFAGPLAKAVGEERLRQVLARLWAEPGAVAFLVAGADAEVALVERIADDAAEVARVLDA